MSKKLDLSDKVLPKKWHQVYPQGTTDGDQEQKVFVILARNPKYEWRSISAIAKESNLTEERVEQIMEKYMKLGIVFQNKDDENKWAYWERVPERLPNKPTSVGKDDQLKRIKATEAVTPAP